MIAGLILAAGESSRMGRDKALLPYRGETFLETIIHTLRISGIERIAVVLGHHAEEIQKAVNLAGVEVVVNQDYQHGQTSSLQAGLKALSGADLEAVVLCLVDHPAVRSESIRKLVVCFLTSRASAVIPTYQSQRGHPVIIARALFPKLLALGPSEGASTIIRKYRGATRFVDVDDPGILLDVDDPDTHGHMATH